MEVGLQEALHRERIEPMHHDRLAALRLFTGEERHPIALIPGRRLDPGDQPRIRMAMPQLLDLSLQPRVTCVRIVVGARPSKLSPRLVEEDDVSATFADINTESDALHAPSEGLRGDAVGAPTGRGKPSLVVCGVVPQVTDTGCILPQEAQSLLRGRAPRTDKRSPSASATMLRIRGLQPIP